MQRRNFIKKSSLTTLGIAVLGAIQWNFKRVLRGGMLNVNAQRIEDRITGMAQFGRNDKGHGYRMAFTQGDVEGHAWFVDLMKKAGLETTIDQAGNIIGKRKGKKPSLKPIAFGSHIDMVPDGGNYDGTLGSIAALEVIEVLNENKVVTDHPLEVIIFADEEGSMIGSKALSGKITPEILNQTSHSGLTISEGVKVLGGDPDTIQNARRKRGDIHAFLELHIEQGGILEKEGLQIGVVEGIVGIEHWEVTVDGFANHAGTTPMSLRQDAMLSASKLIIAVNEVIRGTEGSQVGTIGKINAYPGAYNVIPGKVTLGLEMRDLSPEKIERLFAEIEKQAIAIAEETKTKISFVRQPSVAKAALTDKGLQQIIHTSAQKLGLSTKFMPSGAGHDSQNMAMITPVAMIFVPSIGGISHSFKESTKTEDMANGANVLLQAILAADKG
ncbi:MAG: Zn-dependent hydrolase [Imperialibacter sp.]|uniref:Zn-dependent hydrolase n=1 Tax=Imperialibacter sp. TaxID=2038411 RepID=UPI003A86B841